MAAVDELFFKAMSLDILEYMAFEGGTLSLYRSCQQVIHLEHPQVDLESLRKQIDTAMAEAHEQFRNTLASQGT